MMDIRPHAGEQHYRHPIVRDAIKGVAHDAACRCRMSQYRQHIEAQLGQVSREMTELARPTSPERE